MAQPPDAIQPRLERTTENRAHPSTAGGLAVVSWLLKTKLRSISFIAALALSPLAAFAADEVTPGKSSTATSVPQPATPAAPTAPAGNGGTVTVPDTAPDKAPGKSSTVTDVPVPKEPAGEKKAEDKATEPAKDANK